MQLVAYGAQDIYLTGNPQITFFKVVYRRHTNFAVESIEQTFNGTADFGKRVTATISRNGDLIQQMYLEVETPVFTGSGAVFTYGFGNALVKQAEIEIGGQLIDRQYGNWMNIWTELTTPEGKRAGYDDMVGNKATGGSQTGSISAASSEIKYYYDADGDIIDLTTYNSLSTSQRKLESAFDYEQRININKSKIKVVQPRHIGAIESQLNAQLVQPIR